VFLKSGGSDMLIVGMYVSKGLSTCIPNLLHEWIMISCDYNLDWT